MINQGNIIQILQINDANPFCFWASEVAPIGVEPNPFAFEDENGKLPGTDPAPAPSPAPVPVVPRVDPKEEPGKPVKDGFSIDARNGLAIPLLPVG
jgi:hypothetical protein